MKDVTVNGTRYGFVSDFKHTAPLRNGFNALAKATFAFDFADYYQSGYWNKRYIPYALTDGGRVVANVSANILDFCVFGELRRYVQIGTVMTDNAYRGRGLSRFLLETVIAEWQDKSELIYLFANDTVLDFYPKFGFVPKAEYQYEKEIPSTKADPSIRRLRMDEPADRAILFRLADNTRCFSKLTAMRNTGLVMFYATSFMQTDFYYSATLDAAVFARYEADALQLNDIFCPLGITLEEVIRAMTTPDTTRVTLGFTPPDTASYRCTPYREEDNTLFVRANGDSVFDRYKLMFPILSHA